MRQSFADALREVRGFVVIPRGGHVVPGGDVAGWNQLSVVVVSELSDQNAPLYYFVYYPMFGIYSTRPVTAQGVFKRFWFSDASMSTPGNTSEELVYSLDRFWISGLPEGVVFPRER